MKDKDFEQLLQDSIKTYGHDYLNGTDRLHDIPVPPHTFPAQFLRDITLPSEKPQKPYLRVIRILSACAAVLVVLTAIVVVPLLLNSRQQIQTSETSVAGQSPFLTDTDTPSLIDSSSKGIDTSSSQQEVQPSRSWPEQNAYQDNAGEKTDTAAEVSRPSGYKSSEEHDNAVSSSKAESYMAAEEPTEEPAPAEEPTVEPQEEPVEHLNRENVLPNDTEVTLLYGQTQVPLNKAHFSALTTLMGNCMDFKYQQTRAVDTRGQRTQIYCMARSAEGMFLNGHTCYQVQAVMTEQMLVVTAEEPNGTVYYLVSADDVFYEIFSMGVQMICANVGVQTSVPEPSTVTSTVTQPSQIVSKPVSEVSQEESSEQSGLSQDMTSELVFGQKSLRLRPEYIPALSSLLYNCMAIDCQTMTAPDLSGQPVLIRCTLSSAEGIVVDELYTYYKMEGVMTDQVLVITAVDHDGEHYYLIEKDNDYYDIFYTVTQSIYESIRDHS